MLRVLVLALALGNLAYWSWTRGWLDSVAGVRASGDREPERVARQVHPEWLTLLPPSAAASAVAVAAVAPACLEAGPFSAGTVRAAEAALAAALPVGSWVDLKTDQAGLWVLYMGPYPNADIMAKKEDELRRRHVEFEPAQELPGLESGLILGRYDDRAKADRALAEQSQRGIRTARVVEVQPASVGHLLRVDKADVVLAGQIAGLKSEALGRGFAPCVKPAS